MSLQPFLLQHFICIGIRRIYSGLVGSMVDPALPTAVINPARALANLVVDLVARRCQKVLRFVIAAAWTWLRRATGGHWRKSWQSDRHISINSLDSLFEKVTDPFIPSRTAERTDLNRIFLSHSRRRGKRLDWAPSLPKAAGIVLFNTPPLPPGKNYEGAGGGATTVLGNTCPCITEPTITEREPNSVPSCGQRSLLPEKIGEAAFRFAAVVFCSTFVRIEPGGKEETRAGA
jgi:hypothetical protein